MKQIKTQRVREAQSYTSSSPNVFSSTLGYANEKWSVAVALRFLLRPDHPVSHLLTPWFSILLRQTNDMVRSQQKKGRDESKTTSVSIVDELDTGKRPARLRRETGRPVNAGVDGRPS